MIVSDLLSLLCREFDVQNLTKNVIGFFTPVIHDCDNKFYEL